MKIFLIALLAILTVAAFFVGYAYNGAYDIPFVDSLVSPGPQAGPGDEAGEKPAPSRLQPQKSSKPQALPQPKVRKMGDDFRIGNIDYRVISALDLGNETDMIRTEGKFIEVKFQATNNWVAEIPVGSGLRLAVRDGKGRWYGKASPYANMFRGYDSEYSGWAGSFDTLRPGFSNKYVQTFEVAGDSSGLHIVFMDSTNFILCSVPLGI